MASPSLPGPPLAPLAAAQPQAAPSLFSRSNKNLSAIKPFHGLTRKRQPGLHSRGIQEAFLILIGFLIGLFMGCVHTVTPGIPIWQELIV